MSEGSIMDKLAGAARDAGTRVKETLAAGQDAAQDTLNAARDQANETAERVARSGDDDDASRGRRDDKDRTQTSASEDSHDLAAAAERKTNELIDRTKEAAQDVSGRADAAYKDTKAAVSDEADKARNAADDTAAALADKARGHDSQDPAAVERSGTNPGFEAARDMSEKVEDVPTPAQMSDAAQSPNPQRPQQPREPQQESLPERAAVAVDRLATATAQVDQMKLPAESRAEDEKATRVVDSLLEVRAGGGQALGADKEEERTRYGSA
ncbi:hypothetical protein HXX76_004874 [Chlamydomonas incerta]|uniref:Uncharacterized protein n=1 Tax=Chlamydomonas incerta TaxID=51695 RepID=A0A835TJD8_CHLIN|nr:hypothetical protein HXX76_004874 [Chlamydomonas incerta]|eukprot:KAG2439521.1 hypothetical protein HXX76_004874 [Chlamydomonas incerta]